RHLLTQFDMQLSSCWIQHLHPHSVVQLHLRQGACNSNASRSVTVWYVLDLPDFSSTHLLLQHPIDQLQTMRGNDEFSCRQYIYRALDIKGELFPSNLDIAVPEADRHSHSAQCVIPQQHV